MKLPSLLKTGAKSSVTVNDALFAAPVNGQLLSQAIRVYRANQRQGTAKVLTRSEVSRTKKKWYRQKGTGNARHGARSAPIFVGGGVTHGPNGTQNWSLDLSQKMKQRALISALSAQAENTVVCDALNELEGKTQEAVALLQPLNVRAQRILLIIDVAQENILRAIRNIPGVFATTAARTNAYEIAQANTIVVTSQALSVLEQRLGVEVEKKPKTRTTARSDKKVVKKETEVKE